MLKCVPLNEQLSICGKFHLSTVQRPRAEQIWDVRLAVLRTEFCRMRNNENYFSSLNVCLSRFPDWWGRTPSVNKHKHLSNVISRHFYLCRDSNPRRFALVTVPRPSLWTLIKFNLFLCAFLFNFRCFHCKTVYAKKVDEQYILACMDHFPNDYLLILQHC